MSRLKTTAKDFWHSEQGLVTIEWVGISSVIVLAGFIITAFIMQEAAGLGNATAGPPASMRKAPNNLCFIVIV